MAPVWKQSGCWFERDDKGTMYVKVPDGQLELTFRKKNIFGFFVIDVALSPHTSSYFVAQQSFEIIIIIIHML